MAEGGISPVLSLDEIYYEHDEQKHVVDIDIKRTDASDDIQHTAAAKPTTSVSVARDTWCDLCHKRNMYIPAHQYCQECLEYHCVDCGDLHGRFALGRSHTILIGSQMPNCQLAKPLQYENCSLHVGNHLDRFCTRHRELLCRQCVSDTHTSCEIKRVPEVSADLDETDICKFKTLLFKTKLDIQSKLSAFEKNITDVENQRKLIEHKLKGIHDAVIFRLNKLFTEAHDELESVHNKIKTYLFYQINTLNKAASNIENSIKNLEKLNLVDVKAFLHLQSIAKLTREDIFKINEIHKTVRNRCMKATVNQKLQDFIDATPHLGTTEEVISDYQVTKSLPLVTFPVTLSTEYLNSSIPISRTNPKRVGRFSAKLQDDKEDCGIVGVDVTSDGRILVADFLNMNVKCFDPCGKYHSYLRMEYQPSDLAVVNKDETMVSLWCQPELYVLDTKDLEISVRKRIKVDSPISAISVHKDKIIVNSREGCGSVKLIDRCGRVYWSRSIDSEENDLFKHPRCNTCFKFKTKFIAFVTDYNKRSITKLSGRTGDVKTVYRLPDEKDPFGVTSDKNGNIYVCYREANEIAVFAADLEHEKLLLSERDGLGVWPNCIKYMASTNNLFVCYSGLNESRNFIDCFAIS